MPVRRVPQLSKFMKFSLALIVVVMAPLLFIAWKRPGVLASLMVMLHSESRAEDRVGPARARVGKKIEQMCRDAGVKHPPRELFLRGFKAERQLEAWARSDDGQFKLVATWPVLAASGGPGPKRRQGDQQVPEGCYRVVVFNPKSNFHLSLGLDYPNASDRVRSDKKKPGDHIYIHGNEVSIGCLALGDEAIEELYVLALDTRDKPIAVHIFPARMTGPAWESLRAEHPAHAPLWAELAPIHDAFERIRKVPAVRVETDGRYRLR